MGIAAGSVEAPPGLPAVKAKLDTDLGLTLQKGLSEEDPTDGCGHTRLSVGTQVRN